MIELGLEAVWIQKLVEVKPKLIKYRREKLLESFPNAIFTDLTGEQYYGETAELMLLRKEFVTKAGQSVLCHWCYSISALVKRNTVVLSPKSGTSRLKMQKFCITVNFLWWEIEQCFSGRYLLYTKELCFAFLVVWFSLKFWLSDAVYGVKKWKNYRRH